MSACAKFNFSFSDGLGNGATPTVGGFTHVNQFNQGNPLQLNKLHGNVLSDSLDHTSS